MDDWDQYCFRPIWPLCAALFGVGFGLGFGFGYVMEWLTG